MGHWEQCPECSGKGVCLVKEWEGVDGSQLVLKVCKKCRGHPGRVWTDRDSPSGGSGSTRDSGSSSSGSGSTKGGCFIATAVYGTPLAPEVMALRQFRDGVLERHALGRALVRLYYSVSPPAAGLVSRHGLLKNLVRRTVVGPLVRIVGGRSVNSHERR